MQPNPYLYFPVMQFHMQSSLQSLHSKASPALAGAQPLCTCRVRKPQRIRMAPRNAVKEIFMPALSSTMTEGKIVSWLKTEGDKITKGESVVVVESDKADMDVESCESLQFACLQSTSSGASLPPMTAAPLLISATILITGPASCVLCSGVHVVLWFIQAFPWPLTIPLLPCPI